MSDSKAVYKQIVDFVKSCYPHADPVPLHAPRFQGKEKEYLCDCIESTFVSSVGEYVNKFEKGVAQFTGAKFAVATANGTSALHVALLLAGVRPEEYVLTQALTFVATANAIAYCSAKPVFLDSNRNTLGLDPGALVKFLEQECIVQDDGFTYFAKTGKRIAACVPMHVFGHPVQLDEIQNICDRYRIPIVEDAAESIGSYYKKNHTGTTSLLGVLSFNGNKTITTGGGGMILTNSDILATQAKHITSTAKIAHPWEFIHDRTGFNYRMPNINAALGCAQLEQLPRFIARKRDIARHYEEYFTCRGISFFREPEGAKSNYWLNAIIFKSVTEKMEFLNYANSNGIMVRPIWKLIPTLPMYNHEYTDQLENARWLYDRIVNIPSGVPD